MAPRRPPSGCSAVWAKVFQVFSAKIESRKAQNTILKKPQNPPVSHFKFLSMLEDLHEGRGKNRSQRLGWHLEREILGQRVAKIWMLHEGEISLYNHVVFHKTKRTLLLVS